MELDEVLRKWASVRTTIGELEKKVENYKRQAEKALAKMGVEDYANDEFRLKRQVQQRAVMSKKMVPVEVWDRYALPQKVEFLTLTSLRKKEEK